MRPSRRERRTVRAHCVEALERSACVRALQRHRPGAGASATSARHPGSTPYGKMSLIGLPSACDGERPPLRPARLRSGVRTPPDPGQSADDVQSPSRPKKTHINKLLSPCCNPAAKPYASDTPMVPLGQDYSEIVARPSVRSAKSIRSKYCATSKTEHAYPEALRQELGAPASWRLYPLEPTASPGGLSRGARSSSRCQPWLHGHHCHAQMYM